MFDDYTVESAEYIREGVSGAIKKLGDKILEIIRRCKDFMKNKLSDLKNLKWRMSSDEKKIDTAIAKNPSLADDIKIAIAEGNIKISDIKDLKTFYDEVDNIMAEMKKDQIDPKSLRGRWEKAKKKIADSERPIKAVLAIAGSAAGLYLTYNQIKKFKKDSVSYVEDVSKNTDAILNKIDKQRDALSNIMKSDPDNKTASVMSLQAQMAAEVERISGKNMTAVTQAKSSVVKKLDKLVQKIPSVKNKRTDNQGYHTIRRQLGSERFEVSSQSQLKKLRERRDMLDDKIASFDKTRTQKNIREDLYKRSSSQLDDQSSKQSGNKSGKTIINSTLSGSRTTNTFEIDKDALNSLRANRDSVDDQIRNLENKIRMMHRNMKR